jgi:hypothetical protein
MTDRYSNTLLVSLNNRISIRDTYGSRGGVVGCQVTTFPSTGTKIGSAHSDATTDGDAIHL